MTSPLTRHLTRLALAVVFVAGLGACSDDDTPDTAEPTEAGPVGGVACVSAEVPEAPTPETGYPATVTHALGEVTLLEQPERVVVLGVTEADTLDALDVDPVGVLANPFDPSGTYPWADPAAGGVETLPYTPGGGLPLEPIVALEPDLILAPTLFTVAEDYETLASIAPTLAYQDSPYTDPWEVTTRNVARLLDRSAEVEELITAVRGQVAEVVVEHPDVAERSATFAVAQTSSTVGVLIAADDYASRLLCDLGFLRPVALDDLTESDVNAGVADVSLERIDDVATDVLVMTSADPDAQGDLEADPLFSSLPVVEGDGCLALSVVDALAVRTPTLLTVPYAIEVLEPVLG